MTDDLTSSLAEWVANDDTMIIIRREFGKHKILRYILVDDAGSHLITSNFRPFQLKKVDQEKEKKITVVIR